jgi:lipooligosaccharide transport system permease protein
VALVRPLMNDAVPPGMLVHVLALLAYAAAGFYVALVLTRKRLLQ